VYVNGDYVKDSHHEVYCVPYQVKLDGCLKPGQKNEIIMRSPTFESAPILLNAVLSGADGGFVPSVTIKVAGPTRIADYLSIRKMKTSAWSGL